jgi:hypothetical protein
VALASQALTLRTSYVVERLLHISPNEVHDEGSLQHIWRWFDLAAHAMDYDPVEELQSRVATLEAEVAEIKGAVLQGRASIR